MKIRSLFSQDRSSLALLLARIGSFDQADQALALELIDVSLDHPQQKDYSFLLAENEEDQLAGYACYGPTPLTVGAFDLYWIAVDPEYSGQGIGTLLLQAVEQNICECGGRMLLIETSSGQNYERTRHFYLKNGYVLVGTIQDFYRCGEDRVTYLKRF
jgi:ribosomal protein S18 acetylase RimI-like enzyme